MINEGLLIAQVIVYYGLTVLWYYKFGHSGLYAWSAIIVIAANIEVMVMVRAFGLEQTLGNVLFASSFLTTDILSESGGKDEAKKAVHISVFTSVIFIIISASWRLFVPVNTDVWQGLIQTFSSTPRVMIAGLLAYFISERLDVFLYHYIWSKSQHLWLRNNAATLISQALNTIIFTAGAFAFSYEAKTVLSIMLSTYMVYIVTSLLDTPFLYLSRYIIQKRRAA